MAVSERYTSRPANEETINDPTVTKHYWRYRMHVRVSQLLKDSQLITDLQKLLVGLPCRLWLAATAPRGRTWLPLAPRLRLLRAVRP